MKLFVCGRQALAWYCSSMVRLLSPETHDVSPAVPASESHCSLSSFEICSMCLSLAGAPCLVHLSNLAGEIFLSAALNFLLVTLT